MRRLAIGAVLPLLLAAAAASAPAPTELQGRWRLVEQHYESGRANLLEGGAPLRLEFLREGAQLICRVLVGDPQPRAYPWPALMSERGPRSLKIEQLRIDGTLGRATARYTAPQSSDDGETLSVVEEYALSDDGRTLSGTVTIRLLQEGEDRGSYVLHRRFEREP